MDSRASFQKWLNKHFLPCCYVYSTGEAKEILMKNNLSPSEFMRPFGDFTGKSIYVSVGERAFTITDFKLDFFDSEDCNSIKKTEYSDYITTVLSNPNICPQEIKFSREPIKGLAQKIRNSSFVWIKEFESTFIECLRFNESEIYQQPFFNIYICSSKDDPSLIDQLCSTKKMPDLVKCGLYDNPETRLIIVLNDRTNNPVDKQSCIGMFSKIYPSYYIMIFNINKAEEEGGTAPEIWSPYFHRVDLFNPKCEKELKVYGAYISKSEIKEYKEELYKFVIEHLFKNLKLSVMQTENLLKKESKNILGWLDKPEPKGDYIELFRVSKLKDFDKKRYTLGMIYFYFRYYDEAYKIFNKLKSGLKKEAYQSFINALHQLCVICQYMTEKDTELDQAYKHYYKSGQYPMALRALFIQIYMNEYLGKGSLLPEIIKTAKDKFPGLVFDKLITETNKEDVNTYLVPIFNEKSAIYYLLAAKQHRRFFSDMIMAGFNYAKLKKKEMVYYAINCFLLFYQFIDNISPSFIRIKESLNAKLGELCTKIDYPEAYRFYKNCIELSKYSPSKYQDYYLREFYNTTFQAKNTPNRLGTIDNHSFSIPEIDNTTVLIIEEQDYQINKMTKNNANGFKYNRWSSFNKYSVVNKKRTHAVISEMDIVILRILDKMTNEYETCSNFYARRSFRGNVNEKVYVLFKIRNRLNAEIQITSMKLFCDFVADTKNEANPSSMPSTSISAIFKRDVEYQNIQLNLPPNSVREIELYLKPLIPGLCTIKGVEIVLSKVIEIRHYFNQKNMSRLYGHRTKRLPSTVNETGRLSSVSSHSSVLSEGSGHKKAIFNHKADIMYECVSEASDIIVHFPKGFEIELYENELFLMPISITNNSQYKIKRFSVFTSDLTCDGIRSQSVYCENIFKQMNLYHTTNKVEILAPFIPLMTGTIYLKIVIKFEDELKHKQIQIRRFVIKINIVPSIRYVMNEEIVKIISKNEMNKTIHFNLKAQVFIENRTFLSKLFMGSITHNDDYIIDTYSDWKIISNDVYDKYYNCISFVNTKQCQMIASDRHSLQAIGGGSSIECLSEDILSSQPHIIKKIHQVLNNNMLFCNWSACDKTNRIVNGVMFYQTNLSIPKTSAKFIKTVLSNSIHLSTNQYPLDENQTLVTIDIQFNKQNLMEIYDINYYEFYCECKDQDLTWMGLNRYTIANQNITNESNNIILQFSFMTSIKGDITINNISLSVYLKRKDTPAIILNEIPYPFIVTID